MPQQEVGAINAGVLQHIFERIEPFAGFLGVVVREIGL